MRRSAFKQASGSSARTRVDATQSSRRWRAVQSRRPEADGEFVYAVATTGIYCRPTCPSRRARREHVLFFDTSSAAERAGFRPCKRCTPNGTSPQQRQTAMIQQACRSLENPDAPPRLSELATQAGLSAWHFHRLFKSTVGVTPREFAAARRQQRTRERLQRGDSVTEAIYSGGFGSGSRFYEHAPITLGMRPKQFRKRGEGVTIRHAVVPSPLGLVLVAGTDRGICAIHFGHRRAELERTLKSEFPQARLLSPDREFERWIRAVVAEITGPGTGANLPLDIRGTAFQQRVWQAVREIPCGQTATYAEIAGQLGKPAAVRAVASACAANRIAVLIPCHRVLRTDRQISGYRWGRARKARLLQAERESG